MYFAGGRHIVAPMWSVDARSTSALMQRFYAWFGETGDVAGALRDAYGGSGQCEEAAVGQSIETAPIAPAEDTLVYAQVCLQLMKMNVLAGE
jgi:hypothetical protein